jgi:UDP-N-acetylmuramate-alanine ligase
MGHSPLLDTLVSEGIEIVQDGTSVISEETEKVIYTEAIIDDDTLGLAGVRPNHKPEIEAGQKFHTQILSYPEALAEVFHTFPMKIAVAGAHGKSTTSAMIGTFLHDLRAEGTTITGTLVKAFNGRNISSEGQKIMNIEACEYRNAFLKYHPDIAVVTNIDPDHLDFFKTEEAYTDAFHVFAHSARCLVILADEAQKKNMLGLAPTTVLVSENSFEVI